MELDRWATTPYHYFHNNTIPIEELTENSLSKSKKNVDYFHIFQAYQAVKEWFEEKDGTTKIHFLTTLLNNNESGKNVKVIWYDVSEENKSNKLAIDIFTRLNIGKIPLTNAELVKALFLRKSNFSQEATLKQIQIATEWDIIEKKLQEDSFWYFISNSTNSSEYENRIEYIFDLLKEKTKDSEDYYTFNEFYKEFEKSKKNGQVDIDSIWLPVKQYFQILEEWYEDKELYHLVGFLVANNEGINTIIKQIKKTKIEFKKCLKKLVKGQLSKKDIQELEYSNKDDKQEIKKRLLLLNIQTILSTQEAEMRFPFHKYKQEKWDIEHVNSQKELTITDKKQWAADLLEYFTGETELQEQKNFVKKQVDQDKYKYCKQLITIAEGKEDNDGISNLALLDQTTNRSYRNAFFPIKRKRIITNDMKGLFIPICTKNLFLKYYSKQVKDVMYWQQEDAEDYLETIKEILKDYLN
ncbi:MAG: hypothetical protein ACRCR9_01610 [Chitinophagaceae bacterium]